MKSFAGVNVAHADHYAAIHQEALDRRPPASCSPSQELRIELRSERLDSKMNEMAVVPQPRSRANENETKASWISKAKAKPSADAETQMLVTLCRIVLRVDRQPAAHSQMDYEHIATLEIQQKILRSPPHADNTTPNTPPLQLVGCHSLSKSGAVNLHILDKPSYQMGPEARRQHLDFWQLGHPGIVAARAKRASPGCQLDRSLPVGENKA
jgi:hypothetical protein